MKQGDQIRVIGGEHQGKTGKVIAESTIKGEKVGWLVEFVDGSKGTVKESETAALNPY
ncbi:hypothetical protein ACFLWS_07310 [Chloroflexota bacterium]